MKAYLVPTLVGVFAVDENNKVMMFRPFKRDPREAAEKFKISQIEVIDEEKQIKVILGKKGLREFIFSCRKPGARNFDQNGKAEGFVRDNIRRLAVENGFAKSEQEAGQFLTKATIELAKAHIKRSVGRDKLIVQANGAIEDLDKSINIEMERLREWYGLHFPEMNREIASHEKFAKLVSKFGKRDSVDDPQANEFKSNSMGADFPEEDIKMMQEFADNVLRMFDMRDRLVSYTEGVLKQVAPNLLDLAGTALATKLIAKAGGLERLSRMPSSTIQLIGAEKALFRFLKGKGKSPRHGIIFSHPVIQNARDQHRGKLARTIAAKLCIAAKMDYYSKTYKGDALKKELDRKVKEILSRK